MAVFVQSTASLNHKGVLVCKRVQAAAAVIFRLSFLPAEYIKNNNLLEGRATCWKQENIRGMNKGKGCCF